MKKGVEILPEENYWLKGEDLYQPAEHKVDKDALKDYDMPGKGSSGKDEFPDQMPELREASTTVYAKAGDKTVTL
jgi:hypothetical protein